MQHKEQEVVQVAIPHEEGEEDCTVKKKVMMIISIIPFPIRWDGTDVQSEVASEEKGMASATG